MKIKLRQLKRIIRETLQELPDPSDVVTIDTLSSFQDELDSKLVNGEITQQEYDDEWNSILHSVGWTPETYDKEIDRRWDYIDSTRDVSVNKRSYGLN